MSDTPRTDVMVTGNSDPSQDEYENLACFARQLERELNQYKQMRPSTALELSQANDALNVRLATAERERGEAQENLQNCEITLGLNLAEVNQLRAENARLRSEIAAQQQTINGLSGDSYATHLELVIRDNARLREALFKEELNRNQLAVLGSDNARLRELLRVAHCPNCGGVGYTVGADKYGEPVQIQCEWCFKQSAALMQTGGAS